LPTYLAGLGFVGALIGSLARPAGGWVSDRVGGARVTLLSFVGMVGATAVAIAGVKGDSFATFFIAYMFIFALSGIGNGSTYRMIPIIFATLGRERAARPGADPEATRMSFKRQSAAVIGIAGAIGAFGGFLIQVVFRQASLTTAAAMTKAAKTIHDPHLLALKKAAIAHAHQGWSVPALWAFLIAYFVLGAITWFFYLRKRVATNTIPSLAHATI
jgi:NNP family nitrate/nitrite transporter-like MFS transporter